MLKQCLSAAPEQRPTIEQFANTLRSAVESLTTTSTTQQQDDKNDAEDDDDLSNLGANLVI